MRNSGTRLIMTGLLLMILTFEGFSQENKYPNKVVINGDTITQITQAQVKKIRLLDFDLRACDTLSRLKDTKIDSLQSLISSKNKIIGTQVAIMENQKIIEKDLKSDNETLLNLSNSDKKKTKRLKAWLTVSVVWNGIATTSALIFYFTRK